MKKIILVIVLLLSWLLSCYAQEGEWTYMFDWGGKSNTDFSFYYDKNNVRYYSHNVEVWVYQKYNIYVEYPSLSGHYQQVDHLIFKCIIYCDEDKVVESYEAIYFINDCWTRLLPYYYEGIYVERSEYIAIPGDKYYKLSEYFCR